MFGLPEALMSFMRRQVGLRTDVADATGSLHAKVADVKAGITSILAASNVKNIQRGIASYASGVTSPQTINISSVNMNKAVVISSGDGEAALCDYEGIFNWYHTRVYLSSSTQLKVEFGENRPYFSWQVIEFY